MKPFSDREMFLMMQVIPAIRSNMLAGKEFDLIDWLSEQIADNGATVADSLNYDADRYISVETHKMLEMEAKHQRMLREHFNRVDAENDMFGARHERF